MKTLQEFIKEQLNVVNESESATVTFDFSGLENAEDTLKSLTDREGCSVDDQKLTVTISSETVDKLDSVQDILQQYSETLRNSSKRSSDEQYAQKTKEFAENVTKMNEKIDEITNPEEE